MEEIGPMSGGRSSREKGMRAERQIVELFRQVGLKAFGNHRQWALAIPVSTHFHKADFRRLWGRPGERAPRSGVRLSYPFLVTIYRPTWDQFPPLTTDLIPELERPYSSQSFLSCDNRLCMSPPAIDYPPMQAPASFNLDAVKAQVEEAIKAHTGQ